MDKLKLPYTVEHLAFLAHFLIVKFNFVDKILCFISWLLVFQQKLSKLFISPSRRLFEQTHY